MVLRQQAQEKPGEEPLLPWPEFGPHWSLMLPQASDPKVDESRKQDGKKEEGQDGYEAAFAAMMKSPKISAAFSTKHLFLMLVTQGQQVGHSSSRFSWAQLGVAALGSACPLSGTRQKKQPLSGALCSHDRGLKLKEGRGLPCLDTADITSAHISMAKASHIPNSRW